ncbi:MAG: hypothetical protein JSW41_02080 [Candidatus Aenigmatarchaeota archaeon]|nr:MAG: hypothetical protein JSW41_02080 [Candidatus Aenigmarchaeota archaeon]
MVEQKTPEEIFREAVELSKLTEAQRQARIIERTREQFREIKERAEARREEARIGAVTEPVVPVRPPIKETAVIEPPPIKVPEPKAPTPIPTPVPTPPTVRPERIVGTRIIEPPEPVVREPPRLRDEITAGIRVVRKEPPPRVTAPLRPVVEKFEEAGKFVSEIAGLEAFERAPLPSPIRREEIPEEPVSALGRAITQIPAGIVGIPIFVEEVIRRPEVVTEVAAEVRRKPVEAVAPLVILPGIGRIRAPKFRVERLVGRVEEKFIGIEEARKVVGIDVRDITVTGIEKVRPVKEPFALEEVKVSPLRAAVKEFTIEGEPTVFAVAERKLLRPVKVGEPPARITRIVTEKPKAPPKVEEIPPAPIPIRPISAAAAARARTFIEGKPIEPAPTAPRLLQRLEEPVRIKPTKEVIRPAIEVEAIPAVTPKVAPVVAATTALSDAVRQQSIQLRKGLEAQRLVTKPAVRVERAKRVTPIVAPVTIRSQRAISEQALRQRQAIMQRLGIRERVRAPPRPPRIITPIVPGVPPRRPVVDIEPKKKPVRPRRRILPGILRKVKAPKAVLAPRAVGLPDVVAATARRLERVEPIGAVGAFRRTREILVGRRPKVRRVKL